MDKTAIRNNVLASLAVQGTKFVPVGGPPIMCTCASRTWTGCSGPAGS